MGKKRTISERNVDAEARAVEAGHRARVQDGGWVKVTSDTHGDLGKFYRVEAAAHADGLVSFSCRPQGPMAYKDDHLWLGVTPGLLPCMHAALACRALERHGLARLDEQGRWAATAKVLDEVRARLAEATPSDLLEGLPQ